MSKNRLGQAVKLPAYTGKEKWEVWLNRFESTAKLKQWDDHDKLEALLPRLQDEAGDFVFDQLPSRTLQKYPELIKELGNRFGSIEMTRTFKLQFSRRKQLAGETPEQFASELKRLYDKAYRNRDSKIRQEDLITKFLLGLQDSKARIHVELHRDPQTIEAAVQEVVNYAETMKSTYNVNHEDNRKNIRQVKNNGQFGKLNGKRTTDTSCHTNEKPEPKMVTMSERFRLSGY